MRIEVLDRNQGLSAVRQSLQLPIGIDLDSDEGLTSLLRLVGAMRTPCRASKILGEVLSLLEPLMDPPTTPERLEGLLDALVSYGDFVAVTRSAPGSTEMLYRVQPSYLVRSLGDALLIGIDQPGQQALPLNIQHQVELRGHARILPLGEGVDKSLRTSGLLEISESQWLDMPRIESSSEVLAKALR